MKRVVLVEDNASIAKYFAYVLEVLGGFHVDIPVRAEQALDLARDAHTTAVVVDVTLRSMLYHSRPIDGVALCQLLKASPETSRVLVVLASAHVMPGEREQFLASSGADVFLAKPLGHHAELLQAVRSRVERTEV